MMKHHTKGKEPDLEGGDEMPEAVQQSSLETGAADPGSASTTMSQEVESFRAKAQKADEHWDRLLRQTADFDNFKKRAARERQDAIRYANESLLQKLIPVVDNFEMALSAANPDNASGDSVRAGINMIYSQLKSLLAEAGLEEIDAKGAVFDPNLHEAVSHQTSSEVPEGHVLQQMRKGYRLRDRLIRPATVIVAKGSAK